MMKIEKFTIGVGDRFAHQAKAQLRALSTWPRKGCHIVPVWNKSNREHLIVGSEPCSVEAAAAQAVREPGWNQPWHVDADHINLDTVDRFIEPSDFYTLDVAHFIGQPRRDGGRRGVRCAASGVGRAAGVPGRRTDSTLPRIVAEVVRASISLRSEAAGASIGTLRKKGADHFVTEVSIDETDSPQTPPELLIILAAIADEKIPIQTIAPKFTGRFNKGVDYVGDTASSRTNSTTTWR